MNWNKISNINFLSSSSAPRAGAAVSVVRDGGQELAIRPTSPITIRHRQLSLDPLFPCQAWSGSWVIWWIGSDTWINTQGYIQTWVLIKVPHVYLNQDTSSSVMIIMGTLWVNINQPHPMPPPGFPLCGVWAASWLQAVQARAHLPSSLLSSRFSVETQGPAQAHPAVKSPVIIVVTS